MKVSLNFEFDSNEAAEAFLRTVRERATAVPAPTPPAAQNDTPAPTKRKARAKPAEAAVAPGTVDGPVETRQEATQKDAQDALEKVFATKGITVARDLLSRYGVKRLRELKAERYAEFVSHAGRVLTGGEV